MFDLPEIDRLVCLELSQSDLAQCARANSTWHRIVIPYLWRNIPLLEWEQAYIFRKLVTEDYLYEQQRQRRYQISQERGDISKDSSQSQDPDYVPAMAKYGQYVRTLPIRCHELFRLIGDPCDAECPVLLRHFLRRCPNVQVHSLCLRNRSDENENVIVEHMFSQLRSMKCYRGRISSHELKRFLSQCPNSLGRLSVKIFMLDDNAYGPVEGELGDLGAQPWVGKELKYLRISIDRTISKPTVFWSWLWDRCTQLEGMWVEGVHGLTATLAEGMLSMLNLDKIHIGAFDYCDILTNEDVVVILSGSREGWKVLEIQCYVYFDEVSKSALFRHLPTLEDLLIDGDHGFSSEDLARILKTSPNLRSFSTFEDGSWDRRHIIGRIEASTFIDMDPITNSLKPWPCENSLRVLKVEITSIPRPDPSDQYDIGTAEQYPGQSRAVQRQVYERLARFANLEVLRLGYIAYHISVHIVGLEMSLESGLDILQGLKNLRELHVGSVKTRIGLSEVQWMIEHWPNLRAIYGLSNEEGCEIETREWLKKHRPYVATDPLLRSISEQTKYFTSPPFLFPV